jgi:hypothetical protein
VQKDELVFAMGFVGQKKGTHVLRLWGKVRKLKSFQELNKSIISPFCCPRFTENNFPGRVNGKGGWQRAGIEVSSGVTHNRVYGNGVASFFKKQFHIYGIFVSKYQDMNGIANFINKLL